MKYMQVYLDILNSSWFSEQIKTNIKTQLDPNLKLELKKKKEKKKNKNKKPLQISKMSVKDRLSWRSEHVAVHLTHWTFVSSAPW